MSAPPDTPADDGAGPATVNIRNLSVKCGNCGAGISPRYPIIELVTGLMTMADMEELIFEQAIAKEALRLAFIQHKAFATRLKGVQQQRTIADTFKQPEFLGEIHEIQQELRQSGWCDLTMSIVDYLMFMIPMTEAQPCRLRILIPTLPPIFRRQTRIMMGFPIMSSLRHMELDTQHLQALIQMVMELMTPMTVTTGALQLPLL